MTGRNLKSVVKVVWLIACFTAWSMGLGSCVTEPQCWVARNDFLPIVAILSLPAGPILLILNHTFQDFGPTIEMSSPMFYSAEAICMAAAGYVQWFHIVPAAFRTPKFIGLGLGERVTPSSCKQELPSSHVRRVPMGRRTVKPFDRTGRTPLERVIHSRAGRLSTNASS